MNSQNSSQTKLLELENKFKTIFGCNSLGAYRTPARVNLIGEHIDYNGGKVLPCAISYFMTGLYSLNKNKTHPPTRL